MPPITLRLVIPWSKKNLQLPEISLQVIPVAGTQARREMTGPWCVTPSGGADGGAMPVQFNRGKINPCPPAVLYGLSSYDWSPILFTRRTIWDSFIYSLWQNDTPRKTIFLQGLKLPSSYNISIGRVWKK